MGRKTSTEEIINRAQANGYIYGAHQDDSKWKHTTNVPKPLRDQKSVLGRYEMYEFRFYRYR